MESPGGNPLFENVVMALTISCPCGETGLTWGESSVCKCCDGPDHLLPLEGEWTHLEGILCMRML